MSKPEIGHIDVRVVDHCNFHCRDCAAFSPQSPLVFHFAEEYLPSLQKLTQMADVKQVVACGGEPTLHPDLWGFLTKLRQGGTWKLRLITNGSWVYSHPDWQQRLKDSVDEFVVSVHPQLKLTAAAKDVFPLADLIVYPVNEVCWRPNVFCVASITPVACPCSECFVLVGSLLYRCGALGYCLPDIVTGPFWRGRDPFNVDGGTEESLRAWIVSTPKGCSYCWIPRIPPTLQPD